MAVDHGANALMTADESLAFQLREAVPQLRPADVQPQGQDLFAR
jgi:hypothetical protein